MYNDRPFEGSGYSLYSNLGSTVQYRNRRILCGAQLGSTELAYGATSVSKTARQQEIAEGGTWSVPASYLSQSAAFDIRNFDTDVENESENYRHQVIDIDGSGDADTAIYGTGTHINTTVHAGGIVKIRVRFYPSKIGVQAILFRLSRTAGPTSPADITVSSTPTRPAVIEFTTAALSDASAYTYTISAENGATTKDIITGLSVTADATGPVIPTGATAVSW